MAQEAEGTSDATVVVVSVDATPESNVHTDPSYLVQQYGNVPTSENSTGSSEGWWYC